MAFANFCAEARVIFRVPFSIAEMFCFRIPVFLATATCVRPAAVLIIRSDCAGVCLADRADAARAADGGRVASELRAPAQVCRYFVGRGFSGRVGLSSGGCPGDRIASPAWLAREPLDAFVEWPACTGNAGSIFTVFTAFYGFTEFLGIFNLCYKLGKDDTDTLLWQVLV